MEVASFLESLRRAPDYAGQLVHVQQLPPRDGRFSRPAAPLPQRLARSLAQRSIDDLFVHQAQALDAARVGRDWVVVTGTASGKSLCYHLPVLEAALEDPDARALFLYPTKALAQDQFQGLLTLLSDDAPLAAQLAPGVYDGDTPPAQRRRIQAQSQLVLSNPDMLHASILPYHTKWARFFQGLKYVVIDELHTYRGILGAHVGCVLRRLERVCRHYGSKPVYLAASATIGNPGPLAERLLDRPVVVLDDDGAPRGRKYFALWNPAPMGADALARQSPGDDAVRLMVAALSAGAQALAFARTRQAAELIFRYAQEQLAAQGSPLAGQVAAYRGGYLPQERRALEQALFTGQLRGVAATNALELGIDVGSLDVTLLVGYPGTIASTWQQAGRSGRRRAESLSVLLAANDPIDQYLLRHPDFFFAQSPEQAVVDPGNPYVVTQHLRAAAHELPLSADDTSRFGTQGAALADCLAEAGELTPLAGQHYYAGEQNPAARISLRHMSDNTFSIVLQGAAPAPGEPPPAGRRALRAAALPRHEVIANVDAISAPELVYPQAVYLHRGESYLVRTLDLEGKVAYVERRETDYYTQAVVDGQVKILRPRHDRSTAGANVAYGDVDVSWKTVAFKKIKFNTRENVGFGPVDIPAQNLATTGCWVVPASAVRAELHRQRLHVAEGLVGLRNLAITVLPVLAMCDGRDLGGLVDSQNLGTTALVLYDRYPGGLGYCEQAALMIERLWAMCHELVAECPCDEGCPRCVGLPNLRPAIHSDPDLTRGYPLPDKQATQRLLELLTA